jgi:glutamate--cysteine ligase
VLEELDGLTREAQLAVRPERLWPFSMPPRLPEEAGIPIAALGRRASLYRQGLALRHGKARQMICGVHLNVSFGQAMEAWLAGNAPLGQGEDSFQLRLARNLYEDLAWFSILFGASPVTGDAGPRAVSHRNGPRGYARAGFLPFLDLTSTEAYLDGIRRGLGTVSPEFSALGLVRGGRVQQLNANVFQTEKEFYAPIRLRQVAQAGESGLQALSRRGVGYLELRFLDVDPFTPTGVSEDGLRLMHLFILDGLARPTAPRPTALLGEDLERAAGAARMDPRALAPVFVGALGTRLEELERWALALDGLEPGGRYLRSLNDYRARVAKPSLLPSARLAALFEASGMDWTAFGLQIANEFSKGVSHALDYAGV